jgi:hypothetical protein
MLAALVYLKSLGCFGCLSAVVTIVIAGVLLVIALNTIMPGFIQNLCQMLTIEEVICTI